nr:MAG TPA: hypothetical protein [Caudoviricetes sp.]
MFVYLSWRLTFEGRRSFFSSLLERQVIIMGEYLQTVVVSYSDYTNVKYVPVTQEECLSNIAETLQLISDSASRLEQND